MRFRFIIPFLLVLASCGQEEENSYFTPEKAGIYFSKIEEACQRDNGKLWGVNLYGPVMFVDRETRKITANMQDEQGLLKLRDGVYTGSYPRELIINNLAVDFGGTMFALVPLPYEEDEFRIITRAIHSLFHCFQKQTGFASMPFNTVNMDEKNARLWIKLEWKALRKAVLAQGQEKMVAIRDALVFSGSNRELYHKYAPDEIRFENYEGLATFTYLKIATSSPEEYNSRLLELLDRTYFMPTFARTYGSVHGALYATLLDQKGFDFKTIKSDTVDLCFVVKKLYEIELPAVCRDVAGSLALNYEIETIQAEEIKRIEDIRERINRRTDNFVDKPIVYLELESPYFDFEPEDVHPMDTLGTLYDRMRVSDNWGKLTVDKGGCLVSNNYKSLRITAKGYNVEKNRLSGEGWQLILNSDWHIVQTGQNYIVRRLIP
jgi:hypothetical protein